MFSECKESQSAPQSPVVPVAAPPPVVTPLPVLVIDSDDEKVLQLTFDAVKKDD